LQDVNKAQEGFHTTIFFFSQKRQTRWQPSSDRPLNLQWSSSGQRSSSSRNLQATAYKVNWLSSMMWTGRRDPVKFWYSHEQRAVVPTLRVWFNIFPTHTVYVVRINRVYVVNVMEWLVFVMETLSFLWSRRWIFKLLFSSDLPITQLPLILFTSNSAEWGLYAGNMDCNTWSVEWVLVHCTRADMCAAVCGLLLSACIVMYSLQRKGT